MTVEEYRQRMIEVFHNTDCDELIALVVMPTEKEFEQLEELLKTHYKKQPCDRLKLDGMLEDAYEHGYEQARHDYEVQPCEDATLKDIFCMGCEYKEKEPKTGWIPVSERLPEEYGEYLITWTTSQSKRPFIGISEGEVTGEYDHEHNRFKFEWLLEDYIKAYPNAEVTAWMPLPEPYQEGESE